MVAPSRKQLGRAGSFRPTLEPLEDRAVPATLVVTSSADAGAGTLRQAVADAAPAGDVITFAPALNGQTVQLSSRVVIGKSLTIDGPGAGLLTVSGQGSGLFAIEGGPRVSIDGLTLTNGSAQNAGAIDNPSGTLLLTGCIVSGNAAGSSAGAISSGGYLGIDTCYFTGNSARFGSGGAIVTTGQAAISMSIFGGNMAISRGVAGNGGAISNAGSLSLFGCTFASNSAHNGSVPGGAGGALANSGDASVTDCTFTANVASGTFSGVGGGAIASLGGTLLLRNSTVAGNSASATLSTAVGGGIAIFSGGVTLLNTIVAGNTAPSGPDISGGYASQGHNLIQNPSGSSAFNFHTMSDPTTLYGVDPLLGPLQDNGGPTPTMALRPGSPAIDAGQFTGDPATDQRGYARVALGAMDIGAFEFGSAPPVVPPVAPPVVPPVAPPSTPSVSAVPVVVGSGTGAPHVIAYAADGTLRLSFLAFDGFLGGVAVANGDVTGDGTDDIVVGAGAGAPGGPAPGGHVKVFDGRTGALVRSFLAFDGFLGGVTVATGDLNGDGIDDIVVGAGPGAVGGHVKAFDGKTGALVRSFLAFDGFLGGVTVAAGDVTGDGTDDIVVGAGAGALGGHVKVFDGRTGALVRSFLAFDGFLGGVTVATGDLNGDGIDDIVVGAGPGAVGGHVKAFDGRTGSAVASLLALPGFAGGVAVGVSDRDANGVPELVVGSGPGAGAVRVRSGAGFADELALDPFPGFGGGVFVS